MRALHGCSHHLRTYHKCSKKRWKQSVSISLATLQLRNAIACRQSSRELTLKVDSGGLSASGSSAQSPTTNLASRIYSRYEWPVLSVRKREGRMDLHSPVPQGLLESAAVRASNVYGKHPSAAPKPAYGWHLDPVRKIKPRRRHRRTALAKSAQQKAHITGRFSNRKFGWIWCQWF